MGATGDDLLEGSRLGTGLFQGQVSPFAADLLVEVLVLRGELFLQELPGDLLRPEARLLDQGDRPILGCRSCAHQLKLLVILGVALLRSLRLREQQLILRGISIQCC